MKLTNKALLESKNNRYIIYTFDTNGLRDMEYGCIDILTLTTEVLKYTQRNIDILVMKYDEENSIRVITELEKELKRRASKQEIIIFYKTFNK